jgi:hypothetical protein
MKLDLRQRALIQLGDFAATEDDIRAKMQEIESQELGLNLFDDAPAAKQDPIPNSEVQKPKKRGRQATMTGGKVYSFWLDDETRRLIENVAAVNGCSVSEVVRRCIAVLHAEHPDGRVGDNVES